jgi:predicted GIY-YIG superfamily endonuclease
MVFIYILKLRNNKYYIGKTNNPNFRINEHFNIGGSSWTKKYKPIKLINLIKNCDNYDEDKYTIKYMSKYGINNVRGGSFCELKLSNDNKNTINKMLDGSSDKCYNCGKKGHFINKCYLNDYYNNSDKSDSDESDFEDVYCCNYCDNEFKTSKGATFHENVYCKYKKDHKCKNNNCYKCGRHGHYSNECYAMTNINGKYLY